MGTVELRVAGREEDDAASDAFTLAHLSDPHLSSLEGVPLAMLASKRILGYLSWRRRRRHRHRPEVLEALLADLARVAADHVVVTGDLTHVGLPQEFREARAWLARIGAAADVTVVPGNHDAYVTQPWQGTFSQWSDYMAGDGPREVACAEDAFPSVRVRRDVALIGVSTAMPTLPLLATGRVGRPQLDRLEPVLRETGAAGLFRVVLMHHPPGAGTVSRRRALVDAASFRDVLARFGAELVLHGHAHVSVATHLDAGGERSAALGVPSASAIDPRHGATARYHVYRIRRVGAGWNVTVSVRGFSPRTAGFVAEDGEWLRAALADPR